MEKIRVLFGDFEIYQTDILLCLLGFMTILIVLMMFRRRAWPHGGSTAEDANPLDILLTDPKAPDRALVRAERYNHLRALAFTLVNKVDELDDTPDTFRCKSIGEAINRMDQFKSTSIFAHNAALSNLSMHRGLGVYSRQYKHYGNMRETTRFHHLTEGMIDLLVRAEGHQNVLAYRGDTREQLSIDTANFSKERDRLISHGRERVKTLTDMLIEQHEIHRVQMQEVMNTVKSAIKISKDARVTLALSTIETQLIEHKARESKQAEIIHKTAANLD